MKVDLTEDIRPLDLLDGLVRADRVDLEKKFKLLFNCCTIY